MKENIDTFKIEFPSIIKDGKFYTMDLSKEITTETYTKYVLAHQIPPMMYMTMYHESSTPLALSRQEITFVRLSQEQSKLFDLINIKYEKRTSKEFMDILKNFNIAPEINRSGWDKDNFEYSFYEEKITQEEFNRRLNDSETITNA